MDDNYDFLLITIIAFLLRNGYYVAVGSVSLSIQDIGDKF